MVADIWGPWKYDESAVTPYEFDVTEAMRAGEQNTIVCHVDSTSMAPGGLFKFIGRWGGLYREVHLEGQAAREPTTVDLKIEPLRTWSPEDPFLYSVDQ